ncbi:spidroin-1-like [Marmota flaviventris]|uniref:spidroin-1-like n=1 Tax=Marmota flaviventris TaxID=93162 RepID=UPI003A87FB05
MGRGAQGAGRRAWGEGGQRDRAKGSGSGREQSRAESGQAIGGQGPGRGGLARDGGLEEGDDGRARRSITVGAERGESQDPSKEPRQWTDAREDDGQEPPTDRPTEGMMDPPTDRPTHPGSKGAGGQRQGKAGKGRKREDEETAGGARDTEGSAVGGPSKGPPAQTGRRDAPRRHDTPRHATPRDMRNAVWGSGESSAKGRAWGGLGWGGGQPARPEGGGGGREGAARGNGRKALVHCQVSGFGQQGGPGEGQGCVSQREPAGRTGQTGCGTEGPGRARGPSEGQACFPKGALAPKAIGGQGPGRGGLARDGGLEEGDDGRARRSITVGAERGESQDPSKEPRQWTDAREDDGQEPPTDRPTEGMMDPPTDRPTHPGSKGAGGQRQGKAGKGRKREDEETAGGARDTEGSAVGGPSKGPPAQTGRRDAPRRHDTPRHATPRDMRNAVWGSGESSAKGRAWGGLGWGGGQPARPEGGGGGREGAARGNGRKALVHCQVSGFGQQGGPGEGQGCVSQREPAGRTGQTGCGTEGPGRARGPSEGQACFPKGALAPKAIGGQGPGRGGLARDGGLEEGDDGRARRSITVGAERGESQDPSKEPRQWTDAREDDGQEPPHRPTN